MTIRYAHTNIIAKDWKKLADFYMETFGCVFAPPERNLSGEWVDELTDIKDCAIRGAHLALPGYEKGPTLEIFSYEPENEQELPKEINGYGLAHIAFEVDDVEAVLEMLFKNGGSRLGGIVKKKYPEIGVLTAVYARDPEGNIIEILNWAK